MRKTLEIMALVITIVAGLVAIIVFLSGQNSISALFSTSTPTTVSASPVHTSTNAIAPTDTVHAMRNEFGDALWAFLLVLLGPAAGLLSGFLWPFQSFGYWVGGVGGMAFVSTFIGFLVFYLLAIEITDPKTLFLWANITIFVVCFLLIHGGRWRFRSLSRVRGQA